MSYIGKDVAPQPQGTYSQSEIDTQMLTKVPKVTSTDNAVVRFDGTTGQVQNSGVVIDDSVNLGINVTPSAWNSGYKALQIGNSGLMAHPTNGATYLTSGCYYGSSGWIYSQTGSAVSVIDIASGAYNFKTAPSGTAGNAISWNTAMTLTASGNLLVGTTTDNGVDKLQVNGSINASQSNNVVDTYITGTFSANTWYSTGVNITSVFSPSFDTMFGIQIFDDSYYTAQGNYFNIHTFISGCFIHNTTNAGNVLPLTILSRTGHACNGGTLSLRWALQYNGYADLQFAMSGGGTFDNGAGKTLRIKVKKLL
jgi:hypothetical protein